MVFNLVLLKMLLFATLLILAVYDAREHRIPNRCVLLLIILSLLVKLVDPVYPVSVVPLLQDLGVGLAFFLAGFGLYLMRAMAPGDVKLLGGIGFLLGAQSGVWLAVYYIAIAMVIVGAFYYFYFRAQVYHPPFHQVAKTHFQTHSYNTLSFFIFINQCLGLRNTTGNQGRVRMFMPFAPVVVIGLMLYQYYGG